MTVISRIASVACLLSGLLFVGSSPTAPAVEGNTPALPGAGGTRWVERMLAMRARLAAGSLSEAEARARRAEAWSAIQDEFPVPCDWALQDCGLSFPNWLTATATTDLERRLLEQVLGELGEAGSDLRRAFDALAQASASSSDPRWLNLYVQACERRRARRLETVLAAAPRIIFTKHPTLRPSFFAYTEGQSDAQAERHFIPGAELCVLELSGLYGHVRTLVADPTGAIRDPAVSWDGGRVLFAWKKSLNDDDYHLYELEMASGKIRQLTFGLGFADYEPAYLPNGDIIFASTRCVQTVDCWWTEVSNLYTCDPDGRFLRRLGFDQVHTVFPTVLDDGRVIYTRWDYNDRGQIYPQALFQMNADGTGQAEFYGNNAWFPTTIAHARGIPGTPRVLAILCGHHSTQAGKLAVIDPGRGRHENRGVQLVAPVRATKAERIDSYGQAGELFQYPYPLNERECLVTYAPLGWDHAGRQGDADFGIYWMDLDGHRELLVADPRMPCQQPVPLVPRTRPPARPSIVDYRKKTGTYYVQDIHAGPGLAGVPRGTVKKLRVVALEFRPAGVGNNGSSGPGGGALISTPVAVGNGTWDVKVVLGDATVHPDGSAFFTAPARTPVYFQALDARGHAVQTMRSWTTLQPGESASCVGCHEHKNSAPLAAGYAATRALQTGPQALEPFHGPPRGFSFPTEVQPILDRHCIRCHSDRNLRPEFARAERSLTRDPDPRWDPTAWSFSPTRHGAESASARRPTTVIPPESTATNRPAFSLLGETVLDSLAKRRWSDAYLNLTLAQPARNDWDRGSFAGTFDGRLVHWVGSQSIPAPLPPYAAGACRSELIVLLEEGHYGVKLQREEMDKIACWIDLLVPYCGDYTEAHAWTPAEMEKYRRYHGKRKRMEEIEAQNIAEWIARQAEDQPGHARLNPGPR